jgi:predicted alpha/beta-hydrolase family hydrolase
VRIVAAGGAFASWEHPGIVTVLELDTAKGPARAHLRLPQAADPIGALVLGHGAGGGIGARDLTAVADAAVAGAWSVALVEQPYRVAGRRSPAPARALDAAWIEVIEQLRQDRLGVMPLVAGGRSSGARVACRTAAATGAAAVLCLAFPLQPPGRAGGDPRPSRLHELDAVTVPTLVVQGAGDPFGMPPEGPGRTVVKVAGNHSLTGDLPAVAAAVAAWLPNLVD